MNKVLIIIGVTLCLSLYAFGQKPKPIHVSAEDTYTSDNMDESPKQAIQKAFLRARQKAIREMFGELVDGETEYIDVNDNGKEFIYYRQRGGTTLKADWLKTIKEEIRSRSMTDEGFMIFTVYVEGMAREIINAPLDFKYDILRIDNKEEFKDDRFRDGDRIYVMFKAPIDGYLAIYLTDDKKAYCMLPYEEQTDGVYRIRHNQQYVFFSEEDALPEETDYNIRHRMITQKEHEVNTLYIIFSQKYFSKKTDDPGLIIRNHLITPRNVELEEFKDWLYKCQKIDTQMRVEKKTITITKK